MHAVQSPPPTQDVTQPLGWSSCDHNYLHLHLQPSWRAPGFVRAADAPPRLLIIRRMQALDTQPTAGAADDVVQHVQEPLFSSADVHRNYVDDVAWVGDLLLSKSVHDEIVLWRPVADVARAARLGAAVAPASAVVVLHRFRIPRASLWYVHMGLDADLSTLACGNTAGRVFVWRLRWDALEAAPPGTRCRIASAAEVVDCGLGEVAIRCVEVVRPGALLVGLDTGHLVLLVQRPPGAVKG